MLTTEPRPSRSRSAGGWRRVAVAASIACAACAVNPATGEREISLVSESQEIEMGRSSDAAATAQFGGLYPDDALQGYVRGVGLELAAASERPDLPWSFKVVNDDLINAFALPGGFIYITRGILAHMGSEAELAAVLGHEVGHVTARHAAQQITRQQLGVLGLIGGSLISETVRENAGLAIQGLQLLFLKYGRDAESEADGLGFRYMTRTRHDPEGMTDVMRTLEATSGSDSETGMPSWLSSHPDPGDRVQANQERIAGSGESYQGYERGTEVLLQHLDGLVYGEDPRDGLFVDQRFVHPSLRFELVFPGGWALANSPEAVRGMSPDRDAAIELSLSGAATPAAALDALNQVEGLRVKASERTQVHGLEAVAADFDVTTEQGVLAGRALFIAHREAVYQLLGYAVQERWAGQSHAVTGALASFAPLGSDEYRDVRPHRIRIVKLDRPMTGAEFLRAYPSSVPESEVLLTNQVKASDSLERGRLMKQIVAGG